MKKSIVAVLAICPLLLAQPNAEITGKVLDADTGQPIANARITVERQNPAPAKPANFETGFGRRSPSDSDRPQVVLLTDQAGAFRLTNASAGSYTIMADRAGYLRPTRADRPAFANFTIAKNPPDPITLYLRRQAVLEGTVLEDRGFPVSGSVHTFRLSVQDGRVLPQPAQSTQLDPSGSFRIANLNPGRYYVAFVPDHFSGGRRTFPVTLYPGVPDTKGARIVELQPGSQQQIHMRIKDEPAFELQGTLPQLNNQVSLRLKPLISRGLPGLVEQFSFGPGPAGTFHFRGVPAGQYLLDSPNTQQSMIVTITNQNVDKIVLPANPSSELQVQVTFDSPPDPKLPRAQQPFVGIQLESDTGNVDASAPAEGVRLARGLLPGVYRLRARAENPRYIRSALQGGRDALRDGVLITPGGSPQPLEVVVGDGKARVEASIELPASKQNRTIVFLRRTGADWAIQAQMSVVTGPASADMPPGEYLAFAWDNANGNFYEVPYNTEAFHQKFASYLEHFTIRDTERVNLTLRSLLPPAAAQ